MLFFLHIPRTAGRTFHSCFLKLAHPPSKRCAKSYDVLRLNVSIGTCGLLSSHDDYSATSFLPDEAAIITQLRDPVGRVLSAYEFAVEVAARVLNRPANYTADPSKVNTRNVWPWSVLVPFIEDDMLRRVETEMNRTWIEAPDEPLDPYNNTLLMPLAEFVTHPLVDDVLGNGAAMQVLGLTSYSHWPEAQQLRECVRTHPAVRQQLQQVAVDRITSMLHVGLMEELHLSIASLAAAVGIKLSGPTWKAVTANAFSYENQGHGDGSEQVAAARGRLHMLTNSLRDKRTELAWAERRWRTEQQSAEVQQPIAYGESEQQEPSWLTDIRAEVANLQEETSAASQDARIVGGHQALGPARQILPDESFLMELNVRDAYFDCSQRARSRNASRKMKSLRGLVTASGQRVEFTQHARDTLAPELVQLIRSRNVMDTALYEVGRNLLHDRVAQQHAAGLLEHVPALGQPHIRQHTIRLREKLQEAAPPTLHAGSAAPSPAALQVDIRGGNREFDELR